MVNLTINLLNMILYSCEMRKSDINVLRVYYIIFFFRDVITTLIVPISWTHTWANT